MRGIVLETLAKQQECAIETLDDVDGIPFKQLHQAVGSLECVVDGLAVLNPHHQRRDEPASRDQDATDKGDQIERGPKPYPAFAAKGHQWARIEKRLPDRGFFAFSRLRHGYGGMAAGTIG